MSNNDDQTYLEVSNTPDYINRQLKKPNPSTKNNNNHDNTPYVLPTQFPNDAGVFYGAQQSSDAPPPPNLDDLKNTIYMKELMKYITSHDVEKLPDIVNYLNKNNVFIVIRPECYNHRDKQTTIFLIENNIDFEQRDCKGEDAMAWAKNKGYQDILNLLSSKDYQPQYYGRQSSNNPSEYDKLNMPGTGSNYTNLGTEKVSNTALYNKYLFNNFKQKEEKKANKITILKGKKKQPTDLD